MPTKSRAIPYRPDIDGLRGIAVLLVLLFHCSLGFTGGYVGVDVFFVISGFLITSLVLADLQNARFSFAQFYSRRIRRLLPALIATVLLSLVVAVLIMTPEDLADTAQSGVLATISLSNFYFAKLADYFDASAQSKPFLHMWSLSLEEQFYLFWPATLYFLHRWRGGSFTPALIVIGVFIGAWISQYWVTKNPQHAYFLLPFRGFQFLIGAACIWLPAVRHKALDLAIWIGGLMMVLFAAVAFSEETSFPGLAATVPSIGAALMIWRGHQPLLRGVIANPVIVWFGRISYSTYLVHWPIIVFWLYLSIEPWSFGDKLLLLSLSVLCGQLLHSFVEQRFRYAQTVPQRRSPRFATALIGALAVAGVLCGAVTLTGGLPGRMAFVPEIAEYSRESQFQFLRDYGDGVLNIEKPGSRRILLFGDSMLQNYVPAILELDGIRDADTQIVSRGGCVLAEGAVLINSGSPDTECLELRDYLYRLDDEYEMVIWSQNWLDYGDSLHWEVATGERAPAFQDTAVFEGWREGILRTLSHFESRARQVVVIGPPVTIENVNAIVRRIGPLTNISRIPERFNLMSESSTDARRSMETNIRRLASNSANTLYIDPRSIICDHETCHLWNGQFSYYLDSLHNTAAATPLLRIGLEQAGLRASWMSDN